jgi:hypothetical protein
VGSFAYRGPLIGSNTTTAIGGGSRLSVVSKEQNEGNATLRIHGDETVTVICSSASLNQEGQRTKTT